MYALARGPWRPLGSGPLCLHFAWQARHFRLSKGSDVRPGVPWRPLGSGPLCLHFAWQARHFRLSKGSDVRPGVAYPGVPWAPGLCACILRGRRGTSGSPRGLMYALASFGPGVPWAPGLCACILRGRRGTSGSPRGLMYALASFGPWRPLGSGPLSLHFAWQARHFRLCKGRDGALCVESAWQARHLVTWTCTLHGRRGTW